MVAAEKKIVRELPAGSIVVEYVGKLSQHPSFQLLAKVQVQVSWHGAHNMYVYKKLE